MVIKYIDLIGISTKSFEDAVTDALNEAAKTVKGIEWLEVQRFGAVVKGGKVTEYQATVKLAFRVKR